LPQVKEAIHMRGLAITLLSLFWGFILLLVGGRFLALLAGANKDSELVQGLYDWSEFWVEPFFRMFDLGNKAVEGGGTFEPASLIALFVYLVAGMLVMSLISGAVFGRFHHA
jgi:hypothetical protein